MPQPPKAVLESVLYASDVARTASFYTDVIGLTVASDMDELSVALRIAPGAVLLIFNPERSGQAGRIVPSHGSRGPGHIAFLIPPDAYDDWLAHLRDAGVPIEQEHTWSNGDRSIYVRDPAGNSVELITGDIWR